MIASQENDPKMNNVNYIVYKWEDEFFVGFLAARDIGPNEQLYLTYGASYWRKLYSPPSALPDKMD